MATSSGPESPIPWSADEIDVAFVRRALASRDAALAADLRDVAVSPVARQGNAGVVLRVALRYAGADRRPPSVVVKLPPEDRPRREQAAAAGWFEAEVRFYAELAADCPVRTPHCFLAESRPEELRHALVLEDLGDPAATWPPGRGLPADLAATMIDELAALHAAFWNAPRLERATWLRTPSANVAFWQGVVGAVAKHLPQALAFDVPADLEAFLDALGPRIPAVAAHLSGPPWTLAHGDFTQRNASLGVDGRPIAFDWQLVQRARGARDVAYLVPFLRREVTAGDGLRALVDRYHAALCGRGVEGYSREELGRDQVLATTEVMQVGLATIAPVIGRAAATGERTDAAWIRGMLSDIAGGVARLGLVERLERELRL